MMKQRLTRRMTRSENDDVFILVVILAGQRASGRCFRPSLVSSSPTTRRGPGNARPTLWRTPRISGVGGGGCTRKKEARRPKRAVRGGSRPQLQVVARCQARCALCRRCFVGSVFRVTHARRARERRGAGARSAPRIHLPSTDFERKQGSIKRERDCRYFPVVARKREFFERTRQREREREGQEERERYVFWEGKEKEARSSRFNRRRKKGLHTEGR